MIQYYDQQKMRNCLLDLSSITEAGSKTRKNYIRNDFVGSEYNQIVEQSLLSLDKSLISDQNSKSAQNIKQSLPYMQKVGSYFLNESSSKLINDSYQYQTHDTIKDYINYSPVKNYQPQINSIPHSLIKPTAHKRILSESKPSEIPEIIKQRNNQKMQEYIQSQDYGFVGNDDIFQSRFHQRKKSQNVVNNQNDYNLSENLQTENGRMKYSVFGNNRLSQPNLQQYKSTQKLLESPFDKLFKHEYQPKDNKTFGLRNSINTIQILDKSVSNSSLVPNTITQNSQAIQMNQSLDSSIQKLPSLNYLMPYQNLQQQHPYSNNRESHAKLVSQRRRLAFDNSASHDKSIERGKKQEIYDNKYIQMRSLLQELQY
eukprot:403358606